MLNPHQIQFKFPTVVPRLFADTYLFLIYHIFATITHWKIKPMYLKFPQHLMDFMLPCNCYMLASANNGRYFFICRLKSPFRNHLKSCLSWEEFLDLLGRVEQIFLCVSTVPCLSLL